MRRTSTHRADSRPWIPAVLLKDEKLEVDLVGPSLPILKALCDRSVRPTDGEELAVTIGKVLNGMMSACLMNVDEMRSVVFAQSSHLGFSRFRTDRAKLLSSLL